MSGYSSGYAERDSRIGGYENGSLTPLLSRRVMLTTDSPLSCVIRLYLG